MNIHNHYIGMLIRNQNSISFKAISLNQDETKRTDSLLKTINNPAQKERAKLQLFDIFDKHIKSEAKAKSRGIYRQEDFLQRLYLTFFESLENIKLLDTGKLLEILSSTKPNGEEVKEEYRHGTFSMSKTFADSETRTMESILSEDRILLPKSKPSPQERAKNRKKIKGLTQILSEKEQDLITKRSQGKTYKQIGNESGICGKSANEKINRAIAKIQLNQGCVSETTEKFAKDFVSKFNLDLSETEALDFITNNIKLKSYGIDKLYYNAVETAKLLGINNNVYTQAALKRPSILTNKPETIFNNINETSKLLGVDRKTFIQAALIQPQLFYQKPKTIFSHVDEASKLLNIDREMLTQSALKQPGLFNYKPETTLTNMEKTSKLLGVDRETFIQKAALKQPSLFCRKPEALLANVEKTSKLLGVDRETFIQAALTKPGLFFYKPETIVKKVSIVKYYKQIQGKSDKKLSFYTLPPQSLYYKILAYLIKIHDGLKKAFFNENELVEYLKNQNKVYDFTIPKHDLAQELIQYIQEFSTSKFGKNIFNITVKEAYTKPVPKQRPVPNSNLKAIHPNVEKIAKLFDIDAKSLTQDASIHPALFTATPEKIFTNVNTTSELLGIDKKIFTKTALKSRALFYTKPETIYNNIETLSKLLGVDIKSLTQLALQRPFLFYQKPETIAKKANIVKYYRQIQGKSDSKLAIRTTSDQSLYYRILTHLVEKHDKLKKALKENELIEYLKNKNKVYDFTIPKHDLAQELIQYIQEFSTSKFGKNIFNVVVK